MGIEEVVDVEFILNDLPKKMKPEDIEWVKTMPKEDLISLHHSLGQFIRNTYGFWQYKWEPKLIDGVDYAEDHPDSLSQRLIEKFHARLNNEE